jgi:hypothetical protein
VQQIDAGLVANFRGPEVNLGSTLVDSLAEMKVLNCARIHRIKNPAVTLSNSMS